MGLREVDNDKGIELLRQAAHLAAQHPANDQGELTQILGILYQEGLNTGHPDDAVDAIRQMIWLEEPPLMDPNLVLFTVHAQYGPLKNLARDLRNVRRFGGAAGADVSDGAARRASGNPAGSRGTPLPGGRGGRNLGNQQGHLCIGDFLVSRGWFDLAQREYELVLESPGDEKEVHDADAHLGLAHYAAGNGQELTAAKQLEKTLDIALKLQGARCRAAT